MKVRLYAAGIDRNGVDVVTDISAFLALLPAVAVGAEFEVADYTPQPFAAGHELDLSWTRVSGLHPDYARITVTAPDGDLVYYYHVTYRYLSPAVARLSLVYDAFHTIGAARLAISPTSALTRSTANYSASDGVFLPALGASAWYLGNTVEFTDHRIADWGTTVSTPACDIILSATVERSATWSFLTDKRTQQMLFVLEGAGETSYIGITDYNNLYPAFRELSRLGRHTLNKTGEVRVEYVIRSINYVWIIPHYIANTYSDWTAYTSALNQEGTLFKLRACEHSQQLTLPISYVNDRPGQRCFIGALNHAVELPCSNAPWVGEVQIDFGQMGTFSVKIRHGGEAVEISDGLLVGSQFSTNNKETTREQAADALRTVGAIAGSAAAVAVNPAAAVALPGVVAGTAQTLERMRGSSTQGGTLSLSPHSIVAVWAELPPVIGTGGGWRWVMSTLAIFTYAPSGLDPVATFDRVGYTYAAGVDLSENNIFSAADLITNSAVNFETVAFDRISVLTTRQDAPLVQPADIVDIEDRLQAGMRIWWPRPNAYRITGRVPI